MAKPRVKPLVWREASDASYRKGECLTTRCPTSFSPIAMHKKHDGWWLNLDCKTYPTIEAAKAAAQADYEARILSALDLTPDPAVQALVALLREARDDLAVYVDTDWPEPQRSQYKPLQAKWKRDMELCWRIDAALAAFDKTD